jgi:hypothetical protein
LKPIESYVTFTGSFDTELELADVLFNAAFSLEPNDNAVELFHLFRIDIVYRSKTVE